MLKVIARWSVLAVAVAALTVPATRMYAATSTTPNVVTGGDPQPTGESMIPIMLIAPSIVVL